MQRLYYIDSAKRLSGTSSNFSYRIFMDQPYTHAVVMQASIPVSYYLVDAPLNYFTLGIANNATNPPTPPSGASSIITIPPGNYTALSFITILQNAMNSSIVFQASGLSVAITLPNQFTQTSTGKYTFTFTSTQAQNWYVVMSFDAKTLIYEQLGFNSNSSQRVLVPNHSTGSMTSTNVLSFVNETTLFIYSDITNNYNDNILQEIYSDNTQPLSYATYQLTTNPEFYAKPMVTKSSNVYNFFITDANGNVLDLNGLNVLITVLLFKKDETLRNLAKLKLLE